MNLKKFKKGDKVRVKKNLEDIGISAPNIGGKIMTINKFTGYEKGDDRAWYELRGNQSYQFREDKLTLVRPAKLKNIK